MWAAHMHAARLHTLVRRVTTCTLSNKATAYVLVISNAISYITRDRAAHTCGILFLHQLRPAISPDILQEPLNVSKKWILEKMDGDGDRPG